jgi:mannitol/fructose-specific phosphotransferase system IIA component
MSILSLDRIALQQHAADKSDAIRQAGQLLVDSGCVLSAYVDGMLKREESMSTSLGNGVSIPHGMDDNRNDILKTGISIVQLVDPVEWEEDDEPVHIVIGIAASQDEHVGVLANLADVIEVDDILAELVQTTDPEVFVKYLGAEREAD